MADPVIMNTGSKHATADVAENKVGAKSLGKSTRVGKEMLRINLSTGWRA